jgi:hypothetical protein
MYANSHHHIDLVHPRGPQKKKETVSLPSKKSLFKASVLGGLTQHDQSTKITKRRNVLKHIVSLWQAALLTLLTNPPACLPHTRGVMARETRKGFLLVSVVGDFVHVDILSHRTTNLSLVCGSRNPLTVAAIHPKIGGM